VTYAWTGSGYADVSRQYKGYYEQQLASLKKYIAASSSTIEQAQAPAANQTADSQLAPISHAHFGSPKSDISDQLPSGVSIAQKEPLAPAATPAATPDLADDCTEVDAAKIERFLGISRDAGMTDAIKWTNSDDPYKRQFAADVLEDIGTPDAIEYLRTLSNDTNKTVAATAKDNLGDVLRGAGQGPDLYTVERQEIKQPLAESSPKQLPQAPH
jgi:HEAT repeat protein